MDAMLSKANTPAQVKAYREMERENQRARAELEKMRFRTWSNTDTRSTTYAISKEDNSEWFTGYSYTALLRQVKEDPKHFGL